MIRNYHAYFINFLLLYLNFFQHISVSVLTSSHVQFDDITAEDVNSFELDEDYVHVFGNETITGHVQFEKDVYVRLNVDISPNSTVNGYDISELSGNVCSFSILQ